MVYVLSRDGQPLMPTSRYGKIRHLLKENKAKVVKKCPFTSKRRKAHSFRCGMDNSFNLADRIKRK